MTSRIIIGHCLAGLASLPDESVQTCVTSPPYYGLRDYGVAGQIGQEESPEAFVAGLVEVFREVRRVLRPDGTLWLNLGDSFAGSRCGPQGALGQMADRSIASQRVMRKEGGSFKARTGAKPKDLLGIPWMVAFALRADGWWLRRDIIWSKPNPMPESARDRPTSAHEYVFLLSKSARYFYDGDAIREPMAASSVARLQQDIEAQAGSVRANGGAKTNGAMKAVAKGNAKTFRGGGAYTQGRSFENSAEVERDSSGNKPNETGDRNARSVWTIATQGFSEAHFATMPPTLAERCIKAGSRPGDTVLDPFGGAGTTALVADRLGRDAIICELNPEYAAMAEQRLVADGGLFSRIDVGAPVHAAA
jgi:DNA modification methylase